MGDQGTIQAYGERGVFVPPGMTAAEIMLGAEALERQYGIAPYTSRDMTIAVLEAIGPRDTP